MILLIDNYDSFVHNLARYFRRLGHGTCVVRNDAIELAAIERLRPEAIVISPGPATPEDAGDSLTIVRHFAGMLPILGVCLGHQIIGSALGAEIVRAAEPVHGRSTPVVHRGESIFAGLPSPLIAARYHSLVVRRETLPHELEVVAWTVDGTVMAMAHRDWPLVGVQFHPESVLTDSGYQLLAAFLRRAGLAVPQDLPSETVLVS